MFSLINWGWEIRDYRCQLLGLDLDRRRTIDDILLLPSSLYNVHTVRPTGGCCWVDSTHIALM